MNRAAPLIIRADAGPGIGTGHVMRCLALAQAWRERGGEVVFLHAAVLPALAGRLVEAGCHSEVLTVEAGSAADAEATSRRALELGARWIVGDGYAFGAAWQARVRARGARLLLLDDYGHAEHYHADVVLNQNAGAGAELYARRDAHTRLLLGPCYALLRREFVEFPERLPYTPDRPLRVLLTMGGADTEDATGLVVEALAEASGLEVVVVVGAGYARLESLRARVDALGAGWTLARDVCDMPGLMAWADVAVSAAGSTVWELARAGLPAALLITADNQLGIASTLSSAGAALALGRHPGLGAAGLRARLLPWLADADVRRDAASRLAALVDGRGARRVRAAMAPALSVSILSDADSWMEPWLERLAGELSAAGHSVTRIHEPAELPEGDLAFFLSLGRLVSPALLRRHVHNLVVHASALPRGRGWSPLTWQILEGATRIPVTLLEAAPGVDAGPVYATGTLEFAGGELLDELHAVLAEETLKLCHDFVARYPMVAAEARAQCGDATFYSRRRPADSRIDPDKTIREQFNLLRVCDASRYPAFFDHAGRRYAITLRPLDAV